MAVKVAMLVEKLVGLVEDSRVNDEVFRKSKDFFGCLKLMLVEADRVLRFVSVSATKGLIFGLKNVLTGERFVALRDRELRYVM